jgi:hypothetical protein
MLARALSSMGLSVLKETMQVPVGTLPPCWAVAPWPSETLIMSTSMAALQLALGTAVTSPFGQLQSRLGARILRESRPLSCGVQVRVVGWMEITTSQALCVPAMQLLWQALPRTAEAVRMALTPIAALVVSES